MSAALACQGCRSPLEPEDLRCSVCARATPERTETTSRPAAKILRCQGCGAALAYVAEVGAPKCAFCKHVLVVEQPPDPLEVADWVLPFAVPPEQASAALGAWLRTLGFFRPSDLASTAKLEGLTPIAWCGWLVDGDAHVTWTADSDAGAWRSSWAPHAGEVPMPFRNTVVPASRGLRLDECARLVEHYDVGRLLPTAQSPEPARAVVEQFDVQRSAARRQVVEALEAEAARRIAGDGTIPGSRFRKVRVSVLLRSLRTRRVALPAYVLSYRYRGEVHRAIVHGQDASVTFGSAPWSYRKIAAVALAVIAVVAVVVLLVTSR